MPLSKRDLKQLLAGLPLTTDLYLTLIQRGKPLSRASSLDRLQQALPQWKGTVTQALQTSHQWQDKPKKVAIFAAYRVWLQHATLLGMALAGMGNRIHLAFAPYTFWRRQENRFDLKYQNSYLKGILQFAKPHLEIVSIYDEFSRNSSPDLPSLLEEAIRYVSLQDVQYTLQIEDVVTDDLSSEAAQLYQLRLQRNRAAAHLALTWLRQIDPEVVIVPNGAILEMGAVYQVARYLNLPTVTYEFGEQRQRIWLANNEIVMRQNTDELWNARKHLSLTAEQKRTLQELFESRRKANLWKNFTRRWQGVSSQGAEQTRQQLGLDDRPIALLAANVIGDSLTLGRQIFSINMTEWIQRTVRLFAERQDVQFIVRIHPGERYTKGPSVAQVVQNLFPQLPRQIHLIPADAPINTYDLIELATLGLVYTTTTGLEMAMMGLPVIVAGQTHYRNRGFTYDPSSWDEYFNLLERGLSEVSALRLSPENVELAWNYAYRFFFEYPMSFPWHLHLFETKDIETWPLEKVLSREGKTLFGESFRALLGEPRSYTPLPSAYIDDPSSAKVLREMNED